MICKAHYPVKLNGKIVEAGEHFEATAEEVKQLNKAGAYVTIINKAAPIVEVPENKK